MLRRSPWYRLTVLAVVAGLLLSPSRMLAGGDEKSEKKESDQLPLNKVVLFSSGVGFFEHNGEITGDGKVELKFNVEDINDLLKSMVLQDLGGGRISTVNYGSRDPVTKALKTFAIDLTSNPTLADLLRQIRGERIQLDSPSAITGVIVGVEKRKVKVGKEEYVEQDFVNLLTTDGLRSVSLEGVQKIKLLDEKLNAELQQALSILAQSHSTEKKSVTLNFLGAGKRPVRVGYIQESPVWKTSYRLVLKDGDAPFLQGWAIVENTTEQDWNKVDLTLISGRPISFTMDLYQPLYVQRPVVVPELYASLRPQTYDQDLAAREGEFKKAGGAEAVDAEKRLALQGALRNRAVRTKQNGTEYFAEASDEFTATYAFAAPRTDRPVAAIDPTAGVRSAAQAANVGELFQYAIATPVTLPRQQSAMLPIVNNSVKGEKVSIYNPAVHQKHPLNGLRMTNSTEFHLMQGPITVFDGGAYAGDARIEDLQPGTERLISYAMDLDTEVAPESKGHPEQLVSVSLAKGTLLFSKKFTREQKYVVKNGSKKAKTVLVEHTHDTNWKLISPKEPSEKTRNIYRFAVNAKPGDPAKLDIQEERTVNESVAITNLDDNTINYYVSAKVVSDAVKKALQEVVKRKTAIAKLASDRAQLQAQIQVVEQEQNRIRQNMAQLDRNSDLYNRYVKKFGEQEDSVEKLRKQILDLTEQEQSLNKQLRDYLLALDVK